MKFDVIANVPWTSVTVIFPNGLDHVKKGYTYRTRLDLKLGDSVVVNVGNVLKVVEVVEVGVQERFAGKDLKWIVDKVNTDEYLARVAEEVSIQKELDELNELARTEQAVMAARAAFANSPALMRRFDALSERKAAL